MSNSASPTPWQTALGQRLSQALHESRLAHAPLDDAAAPAGAPVTRWTLPPRPAASTTAGPVLGAMLGMSGPALQALLSRCLQHWRTQLAAEAAQDDLGAALAAYLGACRQAVDQEALTPERWQAVTHWLQAWVIDALPWDDAPLAQRQDAFERFAVLAVALGEWTVQASRQGAAQQASALFMARSSLQAQLGLNLDTLCRALRALDAATAATPSAGHDELGAAAYRQAGPGPV